MYVYYRQMRAISARGCEIQRDNCLIVAKLRSYLVFRIICWRTLRGAICRSPVSFNEIVNFWMKVPRYRTVRRALRVREGIASFEKENGEEKRKESNE